MKTKRNHSFVVTIASRTRNILITHANSFKLLAFSALAVTSTASAQTGTWTSTATSANWSTSGNWSASTVADGIDNTANFTSNITAATTVTLDSARTIGNITFTDSTTSSHNLTISGANILTLDTTTGVPIIDVTQSGRTLTIGSTVAGSDGLQKNGVGNLLLSSTSNTYSGGTIINGGRIQFTGDGSLGNVNDGITFKNNGFLLLNSGTSFSLAATRTITIDSGATAVIGDVNINGIITHTINGKITGDGGLNLGHYQLGTGTANLTSTSNDFKGALHLGVSAVHGSFTYASFTANIASLADGTGYGNVVFGRGNAQTANTMTLALSADATSPITLDNRSIQLDTTIERSVLANNNASTSNTFTVNKDLLITRAGNKVFELGGSNTGNNTFAGLIANNTSTSNAAVISLAKSGAGTWRVTGNNSYTGTTSVSSSGTLIMSGNNTLSGQITVSGSTGATLTLSGDNSGMSSNIVLSTSYPTSGSAAPRLNINSATALGTGTISFGGGSASDTVRIDNTSAAGVTTTTANPISANRNFNFVGTQSLNLGTSAVTLGGMSANGTRTITVNASTLTLEGVVSESTPNNGNGITVHGAGTLVLTGTNTYTGTTNVGVNGSGTNPRLRVNSIANLGVASALGAPTTDATGLITLGAQSNTGTLEFTGLSGNQTTDRQVRIGTNSGGSGNAIIQNNDPNYTVTFSNATFNVAATVTSGFGRSLQLTGSNTGDNTIQGAIIPNTSTGTTTVSLVKNGTGTWVLAGVNTYNGNTGVENGILKVSTIGNVNVASNVGAGASIRLGGATTSGVLQYTGAAASTDRSFNIGATTVGGTGGGRINNTGSGVLTFNGTNFNNTITGITAARTITLGGSNDIVISGIVQDNDIATGGIVHLTKEDGNKLTLSGVNTYTGATSINAGTLIVNGSTSTSSTFTVASTATLAGSGTVGGATTILSGGTHAPGNSPGLQIFSSDLIYSNGSTFAWDLAANIDGAGGTRGTSFDAVNVTGNLTIGSGAVFNVIQNAGVDFANSFWDTTQTWTNIWDVTGATTSGWSDTAVAVYNESNVLQNVSARGSFSITGTTLTWTAVPEASNLLICGLVGLGLMARRRKQ